MSSNSARPAQILCAILSVALLHMPVKAQALSPEARAYLEHALDVMQQNALHADKIDWPKLRHETLQRAAGAELPADSYEAVRWALKQVNRHSFLQLSPELEKQESERKPQHAEVKSVSVPGQVRPASAFLERDKPEGRTLEARGAKFAYVTVPHFSPNSEADGVGFETTLQELIGQLDREHPRGWILDLRGNAGGNMWPMLAGVGPLLGEGVVGAFRDQRGKQSNWFYKDGEAGMQGSENWVYPKMAAAPFHIKAEPSISVLIDGGTASSGEAIAVAFRGRPRTRFFGEHTMGVSTVNTNFLLSDGANMILTIGVYVDRNGREYEDGLEPDVTVASPKDGQPAQDNVIEAAEQWLISEH